MFSTERLRSGNVWSLGRVRNSQEQKVTQTTLMETECLGPGLIRDA